MFTGRFEHQLDPKGRVVLPSTFREQLAAGGYLTQGSEGCLSLWTDEAFRGEAERMKAKVERGEMSRAALRTFAANAFPVKPDGQGRVLVPQSLRDWAGLRDRVMVIGALDAVELWDTAKWEDVERTGGEQMAAGVC
jgi:MraZ protein